MKSGVGRYKSSIKHMLKSNYEFEVLVHGASTKEYYHEGRNYIEGKEGSRFSLSMRNNSSNRALFVPTVDGLSIMNGKEASYKSRGYIVNGHDSLTIDGWRTSDDKVAEFYFSSPKESYAKKIDKGGNLGVIGCAIFKEKEKVRVIEKIIREKEYIPYPVWPKPYWNGADPWSPKWGLVTTDSDPNSSMIYTLTAGSSGASGSISQNTASCSFLSASGGNKNSLGDAGKSSEGIRSMKASVGLGTGFGEDKYSPVVTVEFDKEGSPTEVFTLYYNTRENLEELGVEFRKPIYVAPSAFPNEDGYCERP